MALRKLQALLAVRRDQLRQAGLRQASEAGKSGKIKPVTTLETGFKTAITQALNDLGTKRGKDAKNFIDSFRHFGPSSRIICRVISKNQANLRKISVRQPGVREYAIELLKAAKCFSGSTGLLGVLCGAALTTGPVVRAGYDRNVLRMGQALVLVRMPAFNEPKSSKEAVMG